MSVHVVNLSQSDLQKQVEQTVLNILGETRPDGLLYAPKPLVLGLVEDAGYIGGLVGSTNFGYLHVSLLAVAPSSHGKGYGRQLMQAAENEALARGCHGAYLDTFSFQAPDFYQKLGYEIYGKLDDFPKGHCRYFLRKKLCNFLGKAE